MYLTCVVVASESSPRYCYTRSAHVAHRPQFASFQKKRLEPVGATLHKAMTPLTGGWGRGGSGAGRCAAWGWGSSADGKYRETQDT